MTTVYDFEAQRIDGSALSLGDYRGKVPLIVNTASQCGLHRSLQGLKLSMKSTPTRAWPRFWPTTKK